MYVGEGMALGRGALPGPEGAQAAATAVEEEQRQGEGEQQGQQQVDDVDG